MCLTCIILLSQIHLKMERSVGTQATRTVYSTCDTGMPNNTTALRLAKPTTSVSPSLEFLARGALAAALISIRLTTVHLLTRKYHLHLHLLQVLLQVHRHRLHRHLHLLHRLLHHLLHHLHHLLRGRRSHSATPRGLRKTAALVTVLRSCQ